MSYAVALFLLLLNDHVLKQAFPGFITGKLSDFAGVFAFAAFFASAMPRRAGIVCAATGVLFIWWKSPLSQVIVDGLGLSRVVDWTDLAALVVLPFAYRVAVRRPVVWRPAVVCVSLFAFAATSQARRSIEIPQDDPVRRVETRMERDALLERLTACEMEPVAYDTILFVRYDSRAVDRNIEAFGPLRTEAGGMVFAVERIAVFSPPRFLDEKAVREELARKLESCLGQ